MMPCAVALFSGGLDSMLSVRIMQAQGYVVEALNIRTIFSCCRARAAQAAATLGARLTVMAVGDDYLDVVRNPLYGYGKGVNPCVDCRIYMCRMAARFMEEVQASVVVTGEIVGQRPMSQKRHQLDLIARRSGLDGRLLRPLSARLLAPTIPEIEQAVDREKLYSFSNRGRSGLIELAERLGISKRGIDRIPSPSSGCALTEPLFATRVRDLMQQHPDAARWDFELLNHGRHFRFDRQTKIVVGRNAEENATLRLMAERADAPEPVLLVPETFPGPHALIVGEAADPRVLRFAGALILRYASHPSPDCPQVRLSARGADRTIAIQPDPTAQSAATL
ncbi:MAG: hypothetical protein JXB62_09130 [Pirellulales bacterium]|nr:hypothetical protein [Pirellulales bacterium]